MLSGLVNNLFLFVRKPSLTKYLVTGCSSGMGQSLAQLIAQSSNRVVATARKLPGLSSIPTSNRVLKLELDVTSITDVEAALRATLDKFGRIDVVVNNAGYTLVGDTEGAEDKESRAIMDTNFWGMVGVTKRVLGIIRDQNPKSGQQGGVIVNMSSMRGWSGYPAGSFYHASKFVMKGGQRLWRRSYPPPGTVSLLPLYTLFVMYTPKKVVWQCFGYPA